MALNISTLTNPATSGDVLQEVTTTADFLESVPVLRNLSRGSNKGGDAKQSVSLNQPRALPLIKNPQGNLGGYLYIPNVSGNYATGPSVTIGSNETWEAEVDMVITQFGNNLTPFGGGDWNAGFGMLFYQDGSVRLFSKGTGGAPVASGVTLGTAFSAKYGYDGTNIFVDIDGSRKFTASVGQSASITHPLELNQQAGLTNVGNYAIQKAKLTVNSSVVFDCDFNGSTSIRHGDTKFQASVGGVVSIASPELLTNGNFDTDTAWTKTGGWSIADGVATLASVSGNSELGSTVISVTAGKTYKIVVNVIATSGSFRLYDTAGVVAYYLSVGENVYSRVATGSTFQVIPLSLGSGTATIDSISVTEVSPDAKRDPITVIKKPVLRFDGVNDCFQGLLGQTITEGHFFAAFSILGDGGEGAARIFSINSTGGNDSAGDGLIVSLSRSGTDNLSQYYSGSYIMVHEEMFSSERGDVLHEVKFTSGSQKSLVNNADERTATVTTNVSAEEFNISASNSLTNNPAVDLEFLAIFASITDAQAADVVNYINNRNNVFDLKDGFGYYFYDAQSAPVGAISSGSSAWNGRIVGSDNGEANKLATQSTANDQPVGDGYVVTFADNSDHLDIPSTTQAGWQIVGTSLGTFAYRVDNDAVTELNLLGNLGNSFTRKVGDLYGIILLPASATNKDVQDARKLLIDRGASDGAATGDFSSAWRQREDIVEFNAVNMSSVTNAYQGWYLCNSLSDFKTTEISNSTNFTSAWQGCSALTSFPAGAKLGTEANNVNFSSAWQASGLTSFPANIDLSKGNTFTNSWRETSLTSFSTPLPTANNLIQSWYNCNSLQSFSSELPLATNVSFAWYNNGSLTDFTTTDIKNCNNFTSAFQNCSSLSSFPAGAKLGTSSSNVNFSSAWQSSGLTSFPADIDLSKGTVFTHAWRQTSLTSFPANQSMRNSNSFYGAWRLCTSMTSFAEGVFDSWNPSSISSGVFDFAFDGCSAMTALSVQNILTSIDTSGQFATTNGASGGTALGNSEIEIDYNTATGSLSAATNAAVTSLKAKGWSIIVNNVTL